MADQEFLASFGVEIDETGVLRLQEELTKNRALAEELEEIVKSMELSPDEMSNTSAGINLNSFFGAPTPKDIPKCTNPAGHHWVYTHHEEKEDKLFWFIPIGTMGYNHFECSFCHATKKEHV